MRDEISFWGILANDDALDVVSFDQSEIVLSDGSYFVPVEGVFSFSTGGVAGTVTSYRINIGSKDGPLVVGVFDTSFNINGDDSDAFILRGNDHITGNREDDVLLGYAATTPTGWTMPGTR